MNIGSFCSRSVRICLPNTEKQNCGFCVKAVGLAGNFKRYVKSIKIITNTTKQLLILYVVLAIMQK